MKEAQTADKDIDLLTGVQAYKEAVDALSASVTACVDSGLLPETGLVVSARELEGTMKVKLKKTIDKAELMLQTAISTAESTRERTPLTAHLKTLVTDPVLKQSCGDAVAIAQKLLATLQAEVSVDMHVSTHYATALFASLWMAMVSCWLYFAKPCV